MIFPSSIIANLFPTPDDVARANFLAPTLSKVNVTTVWFDWLSIRGWASTKLSPLNIILLLIIASEPSSYKSFSVPKLSSSFKVTNLKVRFAVFPNKLLILSGFSKPGSSTSILSLPLLRILGSFVPISSTLLLTISIAWFCDDDFNWTKP